MPTLTSNLFWGQGERTHRLTPVEGHWPTDMAGSVFIVGPDKRRPGGHWFDQQGILCRIDLIPDGSGRIHVQLRRIDTPVSKIRDAAPMLFKLLNFMELSPFGVTNLANTNVCTIDDRLFVGYDAGRPIEVDPVTLEFLTPVGANDEWMQSAPGLFEPGISVAAHPAPDYEERRLYFVNYSPMPTTATTHVGSWDLDGPIQRWQVSGMGPFDSIHDIKVTRDFLVFTDLPFVIEPEAFTGGPQARPNKDTTSLWIVSKEDLRRTAPGGTVPCREVILPMPTGHLSVDYENPDGRLRVFLEHIPIQDLMIRLHPGERTHTTGVPIDPNFEGMVTLFTNPACLGRYEIDGATGEVLDREQVWDERFWGGVLATMDELNPAARARRGDLWYTSVGYDPELVCETWWRLYADAGLNSIVDPHDLPTEPVPGALARFDRESMKVTELFAFEPGTFASPPTFVPRRGATDPDDGYIVVLVHCAAPKQVWVFDAAHIEAGPLCRVTAPDFNPNLMLHSCYMPPRPGPRPSTYRIRKRRDVRGAVRMMPRHLRNFAAMGKEMAAQAKAERYRT